jgi:hypothetical protein
MCETVHVYVMDLWHGGYELDLAHAVFADGEDGGVTDVVEAVGVTGLGVVGLRFSRAQLSVGVHHPPGGHQSLPTMKLT